MQEHVAKLQAELKAAQAAADLEATLKEFKGFLDNGEGHQQQQQQMSKQQHAGLRGSSWTMTCLYHVKR
jgi:3-methyladenine DNA glycosylase Tag